MKSINQANQLMKSINEVSQSFNQWIIWFKLYRVQFNSITWYKFEKNKKLQKKGFIQRFPETRIQFRADSLVPSPLCTPLISVCAETRIGVLRGLNLSEHARRKSIWRHIFRSDSWIYLADKTTF